MIRVGIAEYKTAPDPHILSVVGLGSCVGICLYDPVARVGGMAHVLLPNSNNIGNAGTRPGKFADTAVNALLHKMVEEGGSIKNIRAKLVGGASMFSVSSFDTNGMFAMGPKNVEAVKKILASRGIKIDAEDTGGTQGRTIEFHAGTGKVVIKTMRSIKVI